MVFQIFILNVFFNCLSYKIYLLSKDLIYCIIKVFDAAEKLPAIFDRFTKVQIFFEILNR